MWYRSKDNQHKISKIAGKKQPQNDFLADEALRHDNEEDFINSLESQGKMNYHGSPTEFDKFSYDFMGTQGTGEGYGFYFTNDKEIANGYAIGDNGKLIEAYVIVKKPLSNDKITISRSNLVKFIKALDPDGTEYLSNYGDVTYDGYSRLMNEAVNLLLQTCDNDVDLICDITNSLGGNPEQIYPILKATLGYDGVIVENAWNRPGHTVTVAFNNDQILTKEKLAEYYRKQRGR